MAERSSVSKAFEAGFGGCLGVVFAVFFLAFVAIGGCVYLGWTFLPDTAPRSVQGRTEATDILTVDASDPTSGAILDRVGLWQDYDRQDQVVATVQHGEKVELLRRHESAAAVLVVTEEGKSGWISTALVKELRWKDP